jgi:hypothetical protein
VNARSLSSFGRVSCFIHSKGKYHPRAVNDMDEKTPAVLATNTRGSPGSDHRVAASQSMIGRLIDQFWIGPPELSATLRLEWQFVAVRWLGIAMFVPGAPPCPHARRALDRRHRRRSPGNRL